MQKTVNQPATHGVLQDKRRPLGSPKAVFYKASANRLWHSLLQITHQAISHYLFLCPIYHRCVNARYMTRATQHNATDNDKAPRPSSLNKP